MIADDVLLKLVFRLGASASSAAPSPSALLVKVDGRPSDWRVTDKAVGGWGIELPVAKILSNLAKTLPKDGFLGDRCLVLNYEPTDWCQGLAWLLKVRYIVYLDGKSSKAVAVRTGTNDVTKDGFPAWTLSDWTWDVSFDSRKGSFSGRQARDVKPIADSLLTATSHVARDYRGVSLSDPPAPNATDGTTFIPRIGSTFRSDLLIRTTMALVRKTWKHGGGRPEGVLGHNIGAIAVAPTDIIVGWAVNSSEVSRCFHAESLLINHLCVRRRAATLPAGLRLFTSLEPCHMCSGMITTLCKGTRVSFAMADDNIRHNSLSRLKSGCGQELAKTMVDGGESLSDLLEKLRRQARFDNTTGFLDAPRAARPAFDKGQQGLDMAPKAIRRHELGVKALLNQGSDPDKRRQLTALLDVHTAPAPPPQDLSPRLRGLDLHGHRQVGPPQLRWGGVDLSVHTPYIKYLAKFVESLTLGKV